MPIIAMWIRGSELTSRPLPSFVTRQIDPVSLTPKLAPVMPTSASRKTWRSWRRAAWVSAVSSDGDRLALDLGEELGDVLCGLLDRGREDVHRVLAGELDDVLAEVGLDDPHCRRLRACR